MKTRRPTTLGLGAYTGVYQLRGDLGLKLALLLLTVHVLSSRMAVEIAATTAAQAASAPKPTLKLFINGDGTLHFEQGATNALSLAEFKAAVSNSVDRANGNPIVIALCLPRSEMTESLVTTGLAAQIEGKTETVLTVNPEP